MKKETIDKGVYNLKHGGFEYPITYQLIKDGRKNLVLNKKINEATFQCFTIIAKGLKNNQIQEKKEEFHDDISSVKSFESQIRSGLNPLKEEVGSDVNTIFKIEQSTKYADFTTTYTDRSAGSVSIALTDTQTATFTPDVLKYDVLLTAPSGSKEYYLEGTIYVSEGYTA